jgi:cysteine desulfurase/selenocysteine lyase
MWNYKQDFPVLNQQIHGKNLVFLDSAASSQKPRCVIDTISNYYQQDHANVHRGVYELSARATKRFEAARETIKKFINAKHSHEIILTRGTTEAINLVANSFGNTFIKAGDEIIVSTMEHHANIVPWQLLCERAGATLKVIPLFDNGELDLETYKALFSPRTKIVAITHASNLLGTINPIKQMTQIAHDNNVPVLVDGAQAVPHMPVDVQDLDCDFYAFSSHKAYGPTGVGVLYGKEKWLNAMPPYHGGGDMIERVSFAKTTYNKLPYKFEAGTPNIAGVIGFAAAIEYLQAIGMQTIFEHEQELLSYAIDKLSVIAELKLIGTSKNKVGVISFVLDHIHPHDIGTVLDHEGIAVRAGHHCAMPLIEYYQVPDCVRASLGIYNDKSDVDKLVEGILSVKRMFA